MATTIFFGGRLIGVPGSYSIVDDTGLEQIGLGASGIVAVLGTAEGGKPVSEIEELKDFIRFTRPGKVGETFRSGNLLQAAPILFAPASDTDILAGAQEMVAMKVNPATQSEATFANAQGDAMKITSKDYGAFTEQVNVSIQDGTTKGKLLTIIFEDDTESVDDLGGDDIFKLKYEASTNSWTTMTGQVLAGGLVETKGTRDVGGLDSDIGTTLASAGAIQVVSDNAADVGMVVTVYGLEETTGNPIKEVFTLDGTNTHVGTKNFEAGDVLGVKIVGTTAGNVSVEPSGGGADVFTVAAGADQVAGLVLGATMYAASAVTLVSDGASTKDAMLVGTNASGAELLEKVTLTGTAPVNSSGVYATITAIVLGDVESAQTLTVSATTAKTTESGGLLQRSVPVRYRWVCFDPRDLQHFV
jgi:hypothetical protein